MIYFEPTKLHESLAILRILNSEIQYISELLDEADELCKIKNDSKNFVRYYVFYGRIIIHAISFLEEFEILRSLEKENVEIKKLDALMKPLNKRLRKWTDLERLRNVYLAHNFRDSKSNNRFIIYDDYLSTLNAPISHFDAKLVAKIINMMLTAIGDFFNDDMIAAVFALTDHKNENDEIRSERFSKSVKTKEEYEIEVFDLETEIIKITRATYK